MEDKNINEQEYQLFKRYQELLTIPFYGMSEPEHYEEEEITEQFKSTPLLKEKYISYCNYLSSMNKKQKRERKPDELLSTTKKFVMEKPTIEPTVDASTNTSTSTTTTTNTDDELDQLRNRVEKLKEQVQQAKARKIEYNQLKVEEAELLEQLNAF